MLLTFLLAFLSVYAVGVIAMMLFAAYMDVSDHLAQNAVTKQLYSLFDTLGGSAEAELDDYLNLYPEVAPEEVLFQALAWPYLIAVFVATEIARLFQSRSKF